MASRQTTFAAIGTTWSIAASGNISKTRWQHALKGIHERIERFDAAYSRFRSDSLVTKMSQKAGTYALSADAHALLTFYKQLYTLTDGAVTALIGQTIADAGYDATYSFKTKPLTRPPQWHDTLTFNKTSIEIKRPVLLDLGAAGKGYLVDCVASLLNQHDITDFWIDAGGDILQRSTVAKPMNVGLENPLDFSQAVAVASLLNKSLCASSGSRRAWGAYNHILNPHTLQSPQDILATWVVADDTMTADGLSTALFFTTPSALRGFTFSYAILHKDMELEYSKNFPATVFEMESV